MYIRPKHIEYLCENCGTNIDDNWWWFPKCKHNVSILEKAHYTRYQRFQIFIQRILCCRKPIKIDDL